MNQRRSVDQSDSKVFHDTWRQSLVVVIIGSCVMPLAADDPPVDKPQPAPVTLPEQPVAASNSKGPPTVPPGELSQPVLPLWQLDVGQVFRIDASVERQTEFQVADEVDESNQTDHHGFRYRVLANDPRGGVQLRMQIESLDRTKTTANEQVSTEQKRPLQVLDAAEVDFWIRDGGRQIDSAGLQALIRSRRPETREIFGRLIGPQVFQSWIDLPFRIPLITQIRPRTDLQIRPRRESAPAAPATQQPTPSEDGGANLSVGRTWNRIHPMSLGLLGIVEIDCVYTVASINDTVATITVAGAAKVKPTQPPSRSAWTIVSANVSNSVLQGTGRVAMNPELQIPKVISFEQQLELKGSGVLRSGDETHQFQFKQLLTQNWNVSEFGYYDTPQGVPLQPKRTRQ